MQRDGECADTWLHNRKGRALLLGLAVKGRMILKCVLGTQIVGYQLPQNSLQHCRNPAWLVIYSPAGFKYQLFVQLAELSDLITLLFIQLII
jgi:hypothetical protein